MANERIDRFVNELRERGASVQWSDNREKLEMALVRGPGNGAVIIFRDFGDDGFDVHVPVPGNQIVDTVDAVWNIVK